VAQLPNKRKRNKWWGGIVPPANWPRFTSIVKTNSDVRLSFTSSTGHSYFLQRTPNFLATNWQMAANSITGNGSSIQVVITNEPIARAFYRLQVLP
jgi:hypothetical protein